MYDVICIGGGLNYSAAVVLAKAGRKVALIEKDLNHLGGVCLNEGCIPSKNLLHRTKALFETKEECFEGEKKINLNKLQKIIDSSITASRNGVKSQILASGVELIQGEAKVIDEYKVQVNDKTIQAKYIIIGTGSHPRIPKGIEIDHKKIITSHEAIKLKNFPKEITIYGSGAIGVEFASFFAINGVKTNLIFRHQNLSRKFPENIDKKIQTLLKNNGVNLIPNTSINSAKADKKVKIETTNGKIETEMLLVATGRIPNTDVVATDKITVSKGIDTNEYFQTSLPNVFAIGDCNGKLMLAHAARAEALNVADFILGKKEVLNLDNIPKFIYSIPLSYANIGVTSSNSATFPIKHLGIRAAIPYAEDGEITLYADDEGFIVGADIFSPYAEEIIGIVATAITSEIDIKTFEKVTFPHPTFAEGIDRVLRRFK